MNKKPDDVKFAPLRTLDDFLLGEARFQLPNLKDLEKWGMRVTNNLLYYQTNYFLMWLLIIIIFTVLHPIKMFTGTLVVVITGGIFCYGVNEASSLGQFKKKHPMISTLLIFTIGYYIISTMMGSLLIFLLGVLLPFSATFIHASLRLRSLRNKIANKVETLGLKSTPMGKFLEEMGLEQEKILTRFNLLFSNKSYLDEIKKS